MARSRIIIVGAGIVGAACARRLAGDGHEVLIIDAATPGSGATAAGMGHIVVMDDSEAQMALTRYSQRLWDALAPRLPPGVERVACGTIWVAADDEEFAAVGPRAGYYRARGVEARVLDGAQLAVLEPNLRKGMAGGLLVPGDSVVYPPVAASWLVERAIEAGAKKMLGVRVVEMGGRSVELADGTRLEADLVVNACGAWSGSLTGGLTAGLPIRPRKGHLVITDRYPGFCNHQLIELGYLKNAHASDADSVSFNLQPRATGQMLLGSSRQFIPAGVGAGPAVGGGAGDRVGNGPGSTPETGIDAEILARMIRRACEYMPGLAGLRAIRAWTGFRAATPDSLPLIGPHPRIEGLWLATGHEGLGITTSLGTAELIGDMIAGVEPGIPARPYSPGRGLHAH